MVEKIDGMDEVVVPYKGYSAGWNVVVYNNEKSSLYDVVAGFMNSGHVTEMEATAIASIISQKGYMIVPFYEKEKNANELKKSLASVGIQSEVIYEEGEIKKINQNSNLPFNN